ncbi:FKBP-type peptidyl-prolyl cis-trans isomerase [Psychromonas algicola]|uniref:FKBP-type peptidyl-prolyl cis-trans isomerase n=1 Tax=Psychromonas algicola TaxID=2555642 RepID=UPI001067C4CE|nr:FKBP-type peptidyl-prolyl cis-trans isomerase [Psychromonas sp. RZ5]TEW51215.1 FKBP-type peptidyl-prolyl cis-trans isomerase [Psychromonas sp. RZ5]
MKNVFKVSLLAATVAITVGCNQTGAVEVDFDNENQKTAYAIGSSLSQYVENTLTKQAEYGVELDKEVILQGFSDAIREKGHLTQEEVLTTLKAYDTKMQEVAQKMQIEKAEKAAAESKKYLEDNAKLDGVTVTDSGLQYSVITKASGPKPKATDTVTVHYVGTLTDGTVFDSSVERGSPATFPLDRVIPGWTEGVQLMSVGEKYKFVIPSDLAYGDQGAGEKIPAGATLVFEVELLEIAAAE